MPTSGCTSIRKQIHNWMDAASPSPMPEAVREHIRHCSDCHLFIKQWNAVEVGLVSLRTQAPTLSPSFATGLESRLSTARQDSVIGCWFRRLLPPRQVKLALVTGSVAVAGLLCYLAGSAIVSGLSHRSGASLASSGQLRSTEPATPIPAQIQLAPR